MPYPDSVNRSETNTPDFIFDEPESDPGTVIHLNPVDTHRLFAGVETQTGEITPMAREKPVPDWFTLTAIFIVIYYTGLYLFNRKSMFRLFKAFYNLSVSNQLVRDENITIQRTSVLLSVGFYATTGLFLYQVAGLNNWMPEGVRGFARFFLMGSFLAVIYFLKIILVRFIGSVFNASRIADGYVFNLLLINNVGGMVLLPILLLQVYAIDFNTGFLLNTGIVILFFCWFYSLIRGIAIWLSVSRYSLHYLIFYICTLEIAPLLIAVKIL